MPQIYALFQMGKISLGATSVVNLIGVVPILGDLVVAGLLLIGLGSVVLTYFGLQSFEPVTLPK